MSLNLDESVNDEPLVEYSESDLNGMTITVIKSIAEERGYTIKSTKKSDIIGEFLTQQRGE